MAGPQTKHYSWMKALDICGVGLDQMVAIPVQEDYRMDINALEKTIRELAGQKSQFRCGCCRRNDRRRSSRQCR